MLVSGPFFVVTLCVKSQVPASAGDEAGVPEDDDPPCGRGVRCSACFVQSDREECQEFQLLVVKLLRSHVVDEDDGDESDRFPCAG